MSITDTAVASQLAAAQSGAQSVELSCNHKPTHSLTHACRHAPMQAHTVPDGAVDISTVQTDWHWGWWQTGTHN